MKRVILVYGCIAGLILAAMMFATLPFMHHLSLKTSEVIGYTTMVIAFLMVFFGVRSYRDGVGGGAVGFGRALGVGLLITLIGSAFYVAAWEVVYHFFMPDFFDGYIDAVLREARAHGASEAQLAEQAKQMADFKVLYQNPLVNIAMTLMEPLPVGVAMSVVAAGILRRRPLPAI
jgi:hypothetical protein